MSRVTWRLFGLLIAVPALALAGLGLRAVRAERIEGEQQLRERQRQIAQLADAAVLNALALLETGLHRPQSGQAELPAAVPADVPIVTFHPSGVVTFLTRCTSARSAATRQGAFKTPTLRHVGDTAPYMHDGSFARLEDVIDFYDRGGNPNPYLDPEIRPLRLTPEGKAALLAFLRSLAGRIVD